MDSDPVVIVGSARTPMGTFQGIFTNFTAPELGAVVIRAAIQRAGLQLNDVEKVLMGCVLSGGLGQAPARQAAIKAGMNQSTDCTTINKVCGSGMKTVMLAHDMLLAGSNSIFLAGGLESMTNAPYMLDKARSGYRMAHGQIRDLMFVDGLEDAYSGKLMGFFAEKTAEKYNFSRKEQDDFALTSVSRAVQARDSGNFETDLEITPVTVKPKKGDAIIVKQDESLSRVAKPDQVRSLKPAFQENGTVTAANASSISDGAAALVLMRLSEAKKRNLKPLAKILAHASFSHAPEWFTTAPVGAIKELLKILKWTVDIPDLYELNEAFAVVTMATMRELNISYDKVNIYGGAVALGHPLGASGTRIICTLLNGLKNRNKSLGVASLCIGGGEAVAIAIERLN